MERPGTAVVRLLALGAVGAVLVLATPACSSGGDGGEASPGATTAGRPTTTTAPADPLAAALADPLVHVVAAVNVADIAVFDDPASPAPTRTLPRFDPAYRAAGGQDVAQVLLVEETRTGWVKVLLPIRPNASRGWVRRNDVTLSTHRYRILVELARHRITVHEGTTVVLDAPIAVGTRDTPTPGGLFYLNVLLKPPDPNTVYGTYAYGLSGYSDTLTRFAGGDGVIGIHGTNDESVIGTDVSHGCIRMRNADIEVLVARLPLGTPVEVKA